MCSKLLQVKGIEPVLLARLLCAMVIVGCISASGVVCIELILTRAVFTSHQHLSSISLVGISHPHLSSVPSADARASPPSQSARVRAQNGPPERGFFQRRSAVLKSRPKKRPSHPGHNAFQGSPTARPYSGHPLEAHILGPWQGVLDETSRGNPCRSQGAPSSALWPEAPVATPAHLPRPCTEAQARPPPPNSLGKVRHP